MINRMVNFCPTNTVTQTYYQPTINRASDQLKPSKENSSKTNLINRDDRKPLRDERSPLHNLLVTLVAALCALAASTDNQSEHSRIEDEEVATGMFQT